jgi:hypothetical protein
MPKKGYRSLTMKEDVYERFMKEIKEAKRTNPDIENSKFLESLMNKRKVK